MNLINNTSHKDFMQELDVYDNLDTKKSLEQRMKYHDGYTRHFQHACYMVVRLMKEQDDLLTYATLKQNYEDVFDVDYDTGLPRVKDYLPKKDEDCTGCDKCTCRPYEDTNEI